MSTTTNLTTLKINYLTQAQYEDALENNEIDDDQIYLTPSSGITVDSSLSSVSENPVQNKVINGALQDKQDTLVSGTNIKTVNNESLLGNGNITIGGAVSGVKGNSESSYRTGNVNLTLSNIGVHISTFDPTSSDGEDGDIWIKYTAPSV